MKIRRLAVGYLLATTALATAPAHAQPGYALAGNAFETFSTKTNTITSTPIPFGNLNWGYATAAVVSPDDRRLYTIVFGSPPSADPNQAVLAITDLTTGDLLGSAPLMAFAEGPPSGLTVTPDGHYVYVAWPATGSGMVASVVNAMTFAHWTTPGPTSTEGTVDVAASPDGKTVWALGSGPALYAINANTNSPTLNTVTATIILDHEGSLPGALVLTPDGKTAFASGVTLEGLTVVWRIDLTSKKVTQTIPVGANEGFLFPPLAITPHGHKLFIAAGEEDTIVVIAVKTGAVIGYVTNVSGFPDNIAITPDGTKGYADGGRETVFSTSTLASEGVVEDQNRDGAIGGTYVTFAPKHH
jgi:DNA-binding beta-propeller fold protein YncE